MASNISYYCPKCGFTTNTPEPTWKCPYCKYPMALRTLVRDRSFEGLPKFYLGEGKAPLVDYVADSGARVVISLEYLNPTGSFKDLGTSVVVGHMKEIGRTVGVVDSSGNSAISFSYYARAAGLEPVVVVPSDAPRGKLGLIKASGARVVLASSREEAGKLAYSMAEEGVYYAGHTLNPFFVAGVVQRFYDLYKELGICNSKNPTSVVVPLSSGSLVLGAWYAFSILSKENRCSTPGFSVWGVLPKCLFNPLYEGKVQEVHELGSTGENCSLLDALRISRPERSAEILEALRNGGLILVDNSIVKKWWPVALSRGFIVEPSSSVVLAAVDWLARSRVAGTILGVLTGSGLKYVDKLLISM